MYVFPEEIYVEKVPMDIDDNYSETEVVSEKIPTKGPKIFTDEEIKKNCDNLGTMGQRDILVTLRNIEFYKLRYLKTDKEAQRIAEWLSDSKYIIQYMTIAYEGGNEEEKHCHIAFNYNSKSQKRLKAFKKKLYKLFPEYRGNIDIAFDNTSPYLAKAKYLISPTKDKKVDENPYIYGETYDELILRISKSADGAKEAEEIVKNWTQSMVQAAKDAEGSFEQFSLSPVYKTLGDKFGYHLVRCFNRLSVKPIKECLPLSDYNDLAIKQMDWWWKQPISKGDVLIIQGHTDKTGFIFSWAKERNITIFKCPESMRGWYNWDRQKLCIWDGDDMSKNRRNLGEQRFSQLLDHQIISIEGKNIRINKMIIIVNMKFDYNTIDPKFQSRTCLVNVSESLLKKII